MVITQFRLPQCFLCFQNPEKHKKERTQNVCWSRRKFMKPPSLPLKHILMHVSFHIANVAVRNGSAIMPFIPAIRL